MSLVEKHKRRFTVIIGSKKCGSFCGTVPYLVAKKVKGKNEAFYLKETTKDSKKKLYGPYLSLSKKNVVQQDGGENITTLKINISNMVIEILQNGDKRTEFTGEIKNK